MTTRKILPFIVISCEQIMTGVTAASESASRKALEISLFRYFPEPRFAVEERLVPGQCSRRTSSIVTCL